MLRKGIEEEIYRAEETVSLFLMIIMICLMIVTPSVVDQAKLRMRLCILNSDQARCPIEFHSEEDRCRIDTVLTPSHRLCFAKINAPHRGDVTYVAKDIVGAWPGAEDQKITL